MVQIDVAEVSLAEEAKKTENLADRCRNVRKSRVGFGPEEVKELLDLANVVLSWMVEVKRGSACNFFFDRVYSVFNEK